MTEPITRLNAMRSTLGRMAGLCVLLAACGGEDAVERPAAAAEVDAEAVAAAEAGARGLDHIRFLSADSLEGRLIGSEGNRKARDYIEGVYRSLALSMYEGTYLDPFAFQVNGETREGSNVVGYVEGTEQPDRFIVVTAHFDHLGVRDGEIYNGADDNASGTAALLEAAAAFAALDVPPARSVVFLAVSGEEKGLLGSEYYSENSTVPLEGIIMNINLDMVGRSHPDTVIGIGRQYTNLGALTDRILREHPDLGFTLIEDPVPEEQGFFRSDHLNFVNKDIPAIFFSAGFDHEDYHKPSDEFELIDMDKTARVSRMVFYLGALIAGGTVDPEWTEDGLAEVRKTIAERGN